MSPPANVVIHSRHTIILSLDKLVQSIVLPRPIIFHNCIHVNLPNTKMGNKSTPSQDPYPTHKGNLDHQGRGRKNVLNRFSIECQRIRVFSIFCGRCKSFLEQPNNTKMAAKNYSGFNFDIKIKPSLCHYFRNTAT